MRIMHSETFTTITIEATAEEIRSSQSLKETFQRVLGNIFGGVTQAEEEPEEEEPAEEDE